MAKCDSEARLNAAPCGERAKEKARSDPINLAATRSVWFDKLRRHRRLSLENCVVRASL